MRRRGATRTVVTLALIIPIVVASAFMYIGIRGSASFTSSQSCQSVPAPLQAPSGLNSTVNLVGGHWPQVTSSGVLYFSNASILVAGVEHPYSNDNSYFSQYVNATGQTNFIANEPNAIIRILLVPKLPYDNGSEKAVLVTIKPQLNVTYAGVYFRCDGSVVPFDLFPPPTFLPELYHDSNLGFECPPSRPVPQNVSATIQIVSSDKWFVKVENGQAFRFVSYDVVYNQTGTYNNQRENMTFLEATFSYSAPPGASPYNNGSYIWVKVLLPFNGTLTRPWSLAISRFDGQFVVNSALESCRGTWVS